MPEIPSIFLFPTTREPKDWIPQFSLGLQRQWAYMAQAFNSSQATLPWVNVLDKGASPSASAAANTTAFHAAVDDLPDGGILQLGRGVYDHNELVIDTHRIIVAGVGKHATQLNYIPTTGDTALTFAINDTTDIVQCGLRDLGIISSDISAHKVGIALHKVTEFGISNVAVGGGGGTFTGSASIGLRIRGHDIGAVRDLSINADQPLSIEANPNSDFDLDGWRFEQVYLIAKDDDTQPVLKVATGINVTNVVFDGLMLIHGSNGVDWVDTTSTARSANIAFKNVRWELSADTDAWFFDVESNFGMDFLRLENCVSGAGGAFNKGFKFRKIRHLTLENCEYSNTLTGLDTDSTVVNLDLQNVRFPNTTITLPASVFRPQLTAAIATADLAAANNNLNGTILLEHVDASNCNLVAYKDGKRWKVALTES